MLSCGNVEMFIPMSVFWKTVFLLFAGRPMDFNDFDNYVFEFYTEMLLERLEVYAAA